MRQKDRLAYKMMDYRNKHDSYEEGYWFTNYGVLHIWWTHHWNYEYILVKDLPSVTLASMEEKKSCSI